MASSQSSNSKSRRTENSSSKSRRTENSATGAKHSVSTCLGVQGVSLSALRGIANKLSDENVSARFMRDITPKLFSEVKRTIVLPLTAGGEHRWEVADPSLLVSMSVRYSTEMEKVFANSLRLHPCTEERPWSLVVTWDEFTPGNMLQPHNARKTMVANFSFLELECRSDCAWWTMAVALTTKIQEVQGGWSKMLRELLRMSLVGPSGMHTAGIPLMLQGEHIVIYAKVVCLLSDGDGLRQAMQWNGGGSLKPCFRHWNCLMKGHPMAQTSDRYVAIESPEVAKFQLWSEADWRTAIDVCVVATNQYSSGAMSRTALIDTYRWMGYKATQDGLLADPELRRHIKFIDVLRYDWAHTLLSNSIVGREMWGLIAAAERHGLFTQQDIREFLSEAWEFPGRGRSGTSKEKALWMIFNEWRQETHANHGTMKASMSELLGLYALLRHFVEARVADHTQIADEVYLFGLTCKALDLLLAAKKRRVDVREAGRQLLLTLEEHMQSHVRVHGGQYVIPKSHWAFDIAECMVADGFLVDAFTLERLHLRVKAVATNCKNLTVYEKSVMAGVTNAHVNLMDDTKDWGSPCNLLGPVTDWPGAPNISIADTAQYYSEVFMVDSFVFRGFVGGWVRVLVWVGSQSGSQSL